MENFSSWFSLPNLAFGILFLALLMAFVRLLRGPHMADCVVALDLISVIAVGAVVVHTVASNEPVYLDAAIAVALIGFLGSITFARYMERRARDE